MRNARYKCEYCFFSISRQVSRQEEDMKKKGKKQQSWNIINLES